MRSDLVFGAHVLVPNRFLLCKLASKATRAFHRPGSRLHDTMNDVLERFSQAKSIADVQAPQERAVLPIRRRKIVPPDRHAPIRPASVQISRVDRASIELELMLGDLPAYIGAESVPKSAVPSATGVVLYPDIGNLGE